jgi:hypothetical protein
VIERAVQGPQRPKQPRELSCLPLWLAQALVQGRLPVDQAWNGPHEGLLEVEAQPAALRLKQSLDLKPSVRDKQ